MLPVALSQGSVAFPRGFPTELSHVPPWYESILGVTVETVQEMRFLWSGLRHLSDFCNGGTIPGVPLYFPFERASS